MPSFLRIVSIAVMLAVAHSQGTGVILKAQGAAGSPASTGLQVSLTDKGDANIINKTEITDNITNECGRTLLAGNIDIGAATEDLLAMKNVITSVSNGSMVAVTINQGGAEGMGPYTCDLDLTSNAGSASGQTPLTVAETDGSSGTIGLSVTMPTNMACIGGSTGNVCTVRCFNKQNLGGCFAVQQTDITPAALTPATIKTAATLASIYAQVVVDNQDLSTTVKANEEGKTESEKGVLAANALVNGDPTTSLKGASSTSAGGKNSINASLLISLLCVGIWVL